MKLVAQPQSTAVQSLARVLISDGDLTTRLTLQTLLEAVGFQVHAAASPAEAVDKLDDQEYELVLSDHRRVLAHARTRVYQPATALVTSQIDSSDTAPVYEPEMLVEAEDLPNLLSQIADLISLRATRNVQRLLEATGN